MTTGIETAATQELKRRREFAERRQIVEAARRDFVPICHAVGLQISRCLWDEAWLAYTKKYGRDEAQYVRILNEGFYAEELDTLRPGWRPVEQELERLRAEVARLSAILVFQIMP